MTTFLFVRHGHSLSNAARTFTGQLDVPLSEIGLRQAELASAYILGNYRVDAVYASDLCRAAATVRPLADALGLEIRTEPAFREIHGGAWEGMTMDAIAAAYPEEYELWLRHIGSSRPTGGESNDEVLSRALTRIGELAAENEGKTVVVATHAGVLRTLECAWRGLPLAEMHSFSYVPNGSTSEVLWDGGRLIPVRTRIDSYLADCMTNLPSNI